MVTTLNNIDLGTIKDESVEKVGNIIGLALYDTDSDETEAFDFGGATRIITVQGTKTNTDAQLKVFIEEVESLIGKAQDDPVVYSSDFRGNINVKVMSVRSSKRRINTLDYVIKLMEGV